MFYPETLHDHIFTGTIAKGFTSLNPGPTPAKDGKIPIFSTWKERIANHEVGLDALLNLSGLYSFKADQEALDARVSSLIDS